MEKVIETYQDYPLWLRLYLGSGWFTASRQEFKKIEVFFLILGVIFASVWCIGLLIENDIYRIGMFACISCFLGAYNVSISIRVGDKYALWSKLESTLPKGLFGVFRKR